MATIVGFQLYLTLTSWNLMAEWAESIFITPLVSISQKNCKTAPVTNVNRDFVSHIFILAAGGK